MEADLVGQALFVTVTLVSILTSHMRKKRNEGSTQRNVCSVSAPGKALVAGGYLVLEEPNVGIVVSCTARFYATVTALCRGGQHSDLLIRVQSPQFHSEFVYSFNMEKGHLRCASESGNDFVEKCLCLVLAFARRFMGEDKFRSILCTMIREKKELGIKLRADNDFYSQITKLKSKGLPLLSSSLAQIPRFAPLERDEGGHVIVSKTGMGSSAALTTALVGALLKWFGIVDLGDKGEAKEKDRIIVHNVAQLAHAVAQGKIGSGFDVAAAVYGTQVYTRFSPEPLQECMDANASSGAIHRAVMDGARWTHTRRELELPPDVDIVMGDVCGGSSSTAMAKEVLKWKKVDPESSSVWDALARANSDIALLVQKLVTLSTTNASSYAGAVRVLSKFSRSDYEATPKAKPASRGSAADGVDEVVEVFVQLRDAFARARRLLRTMGDRAGVGIEPAQQTRLVDATEDIAGVLCAGVPGAGGVDAVHAIVLTPQARERVEQMWSTWESKSAAAVRPEEGEVAPVVCPLTLRADKGSGSGVRAEPDMLWD